MMHSQTDKELLRQAALGSRDALAQIARQHVGFVYHSALRQVRDPHLAEDITQAVFVILSSKIRRLKPGTVLHAWLFNTTRFAAANARKLRSRRIYHESKAAVMRPEATSPSTADSEAITPLLNEALAELGELDRSAVLLSFLGGKTYPEVGAAIGKSEEAARKRVTRAIERMRAFFVRRGIAAGSTGLVVAMQTSAGAAVPERLVGAVTSSLLSAPPGAAATAIAQGVIQMMHWMKIKFVAGCAGLVVLCLAGGMLVASGGSAPEPAAQPPGHTSVHLGDRIRVELLGVSTVPVESDLWWSANGRTVPAPCDQRDPSSLSDGGYQAALLVEAPEGSSIAVRASPSMGSNSDDAQRDGRPLAGVTLIEFEVEDGQITVDFLVRVGSGAFQTLIDCDDPGNGAVAEFGDGQINLLPLTVDNEGRARAVFEHQLSDYDIRVRAIDASGKEHAPVLQMSQEEPNSVELSVSFDVAPDRVRRIQLSARALDKWAYFAKVPLDPARKTEFQILSGDDPTTQPGR